VAGLAAAAGGPGGVPRPGPASWGAAEREPLVRGGEHTRRPAVLENGDRMLEVGGERAIFGDHRPFVVERADIGAAHVHHRFDGDRHPRDEAWSAPGLAVVRNLGILV